MDIKTFYKNNPNFNWKYYTTIYEDIKKANIDTEEKAISHYLKYGIKQNRKTYEIEIKDEIFNLGLISNECYLSNALIHFKKRLYKKYNLTDYKNSNNAVIFFGLYTDDDIKILINHKGMRYLIWGGEDANFNNTHSLASLNNIKKLKNIIHLSISQCIFDRLNKQNINSIIIDFNIVDNTIFKPINIYGNMIYIYNGHTMGRENIYGKEIYEEVIKRLPNYTFIQSNMLNEPYENMPKIYAQCFIALRLTKYDGNANTVQELEAMNIPVIHNQSNYGLKWENINDIIKHIQDASCKK